MKKAPTPNTMLRLVCKFWHWPDRTIGKRESRKLREDHNKAVNQLHEAIEALIQILPVMVDMTATANKEQSELRGQAINAARKVVANALGEFSVIEYSSFYAVRHNPTQKEHPMGDGVDTLTDEDGNSLMCGTEEFRLLWEQCLNASHGETLEAYFPELVKEYG